MGWSGGRVAVVDRAYDRVVVAVGRVYDPVVEGEEDDHELARAHAW